MKNRSFFKKPIYSALIFFGTLGVLSAGYAGFVTLQSSDADSGKSLTSTMMQAVIGNLADLDSRVTGATTSLASLSGAVSSLQVSAGSLWTTVTGGIGYSAGNVGIGTSTPNSLLHVYKDSGNNAELDLQSVAGTNKHWGIYQNRADESLRFWNNTAGGDSVTVTNGGRVGIGTSAPTQKLSIVGGQNDQLILDNKGENTTTANWANNGTVKGQIYYDLSGNVFEVGAVSATSRLGFVTNANERMSITGSGNVGIGTISPAAKLDVQSSGIIGASFKGTATGPSGLIHIENTNTATSWNIWIETGGATWASGVAGTFYIDQNAIGPKLSIAPSGNVGIGTANPWSKLDVAGDIKATSGGTIGVTKINGVWGSAAVHIPPSVNTYAGDNITLPPGNWIVYYEAFYDHDGTTLFSASSYNHPGISTTTTNAGVISWGNLTGCSQIFCPIKTAYQINNTWATPATYYIIHAIGQYTGTYVHIRENFGNFYAIKVN